MKTTIEKSDDVGDYTIHVNDSTVSIIDKQLPNYILITRKDWEEITYTVTAMQIEIESNLASIGVTNG